ncbi:allophanate hydrolase [Burkholderia sp. Leaf177]|uniref:5-oxoprolinase subunit PxpB n=1 Tax=Burkholderia sp. Leaf177 TaxID=1736287 RepID=UPI0006FC72A2|nr:5-oxoprolinase subunit PxpB [Burkholderia sp. Leaf177]KQR80025.1 allophanate hydrolase [Burkholderia sp. Leaf177]
MTSPKIYPLGDSALVCEAPAPATLECQRRIWALADAARLWPNIVEVVPGMNNLTLVFDPLQTEQTALALTLKTAWDEALEADVGTTEIEIPVRYGGTDGPDLAALAKHLKLSIDELVKRHTQADYIVFFLGFQPGFAYLGGLDPTLNAPRHPKPRLEVPAGSVGIGGEQTGIYPAVSPGGWQLLGRTDVKLFDPARNPPTLMQPGDHVRFTALEVLA